jgi:hypothetical protein
MKSKKERIISLQEWNETVRKTYGRPYHFQQQDGCKDRGMFRFSVPDEYTDDCERDIVPEVVNHQTMGVSFKAWLARDPKKPLADGSTDFSLELWWDRNFYPDVQMIANDLHAKGLLKKGDYVIEIDW